MSLNTIISASLVKSAPRAALVLMGGGARTAYQAGALQAIGAMLDLRPSGGSAFPFKILVGTSAGALNSAFLASRAAQGTDALARLAPFWRDLNSSAVYHLHAPMWTRASKWLAGLSLAHSTRALGGMLDNTPLADALHKAISLPAIEAAIGSGVLSTLAVTASSYSSGMHWTFCQSGPRHPKPWDGPGRRIAFEPITMDHLLASAAIPFIFPANALYVGGQREFFGDGSMRQVSPLSPAMHLGASQVLVIGVGQPNRSSLAGGAVAQAPSSVADRRPSLGMVAGHAMASVFHDTLQADVEQARRVTQTLRQLPPEVAAALSYRPVDVLALSPSQSLDALALVHANALPRAVRRMLESLGGLQGSGSALASYLMFERPFVDALIALGEQDAYARKVELLEFFDKAQATGAFDATQGLWVDGARQ